MNTFFKNLFNIKQINTLLTLGIFEKEKYKKPT